MVIGNKKNLKSKGQERLLPVAHTECTQTLHELAPQLRSVLESHIEERKRYHPV